MQVTASTNQCADRRTFCRWVSVKRPAVIWLHPCKRSSTSFTSILAPCLQGNGEDPLGKESNVPEKQTIEKAKRAKRSGKAPTTQASEFVREEMHHVREGKHGARSTKQAIAIGLSKARSAGVELPPPAKGKTSDITRR